MCTLVRGRAGSQSGRPPGTSSCNGARRSGSRSTAQHRTSAWPTRAQRAAVRTALRSAGGHRAHVSPAQRCESRRARARARASQPRLQRTGRRASERRCAAEGCLQRRPWRIRLLQLRKHNLARLTPVRNEIAWPWKARYLRSTAATRWLRVRQRQCEKGGSRPELARKPRWDAAQSATNYQPS